MSVAPAEETMQSRRGNATLAKKFKECLWLSDEQWEQEAMSVSFLLCQCVGKARAIRKQQLLAQAPAETMDAKELEEAFAKAQR